MKSEKIISKLICSAVTASVLIFNQLSICSVKADDYQSDYKMGCISQTQEELIEFFGEPITSYNAREALPDSIDLSTSPCFPTIGDQGSLGSCTSFASTYYQYSYEVNKLNNVTSTEDRVIYSPKWTYNLVNGGKDKGTKLEKNYMVLKNWGCLKNNDFHYTGKSNDYLEIPANLDNEKIEALSTRVESYSMYSIPNEAQISSPSSSALNIIKSQLKNGKVLTASTKCMFNSKMVNGECIAYRCTQNSMGSHAVTIVGYDDNKYCDVNGNGIIEECEKGAFKVANSWGTTYDAYGIQSTTGYFWTLYDSLNYKSTNIVNNWEKDLTGKRCSMFSNVTYSDGYNNFYSMDVAHKNLNIIGQLKVNTTNRESLTLSIDRLMGTQWEGNYSKQLYPFDGLSGEKGIAFNGYLYFDYDDYASPISSYIMGYNWFVHLMGVPKSDIYGFCIIDNLGNKIGYDKHLTRTGAQAYGYQNISLQIGDVNYDGSVTEEDAQCITNYILQVNELSNVQYYLADCSKDGEVNSVDIVVLRRSYMK